MTLEQLGNLGEFLAAVATLVTLAYLAIQVRYAKVTASDANRLMRTNGVRDMILMQAANDEFRTSTAKAFGIEPYYDAFAERFQITAIDAGRVENMSLYYFWLHWGQYASSKSIEDIRELTNLVANFYTLPAIRYAWENSPFARPLLDREFVAFVDGILAESDRETDASPS